ncbi:MAG: hypothetical protein ABJ360_17465 [Roseobacter sp.]
MSEIEELNGRILSAMDRVAKGIEALGPDESEALRNALDEERQVNAQLTERVSLLGDRQEKAVAAMEEKAAEAQVRMEALDIELQQLRQAHEVLAQACETLRTANAEGVGDPEQINAAVLAELEATRSMRRAERAEADEIIAGLMPLLNASGQQQTSEEAP